MWRATLKEDAIRKSDPLDKPPTNRVEKLMEVIQRMIIVE
jgi:hypothetical protein